MPVDTKPPLLDKGVLPRHLAESVRVALADTRVVVVIGARQVGKSTLVEQFANGEPPMRVVSLDEDVMRRTAIEDPTGFIADLETPAVIDEVQRAPDLLLTIKRSVDVDQRPGRFLLTGSANILTAPTIADALTGRAEYLRLWPFSQVELRQAPPRFIASLFGARPPRIRDAASGRHAYADLLVAGGFPEALRRGGTRRRRFFDSYLDTVLERDLTTIARVHDRANVRRLLEAIGATAGSPIRMDGIARALEVATNTVRAHIDLLETLFLVYRLPAWHSNRLKRLTKAPKLHLVDSGLLAHLLQANAERAVSDGNVMGALVETFVVMEVVRQAAADADPPRLFHLRDRDGHEVDLLLERGDGTVAGIEMKAAATAGPADFRGLKLLRDRLGDRFAFGAVLYTGPATVPFGDRLAAVPLAGLWSA
jgi:predicted AAA+ superfamily ATPase